MLRLSGLDYLRGLCAFGIMVFHYSLWYIGVESASNMFTRIGIYGVSIFYILSGLTLYHVYSKTLKPTAADLKLFYFKRILRIFPLLWFATWFRILIAWKLPEKEILFTNLSGLFALYKWEQTIAFGAWSIGNELVFYLFFPIMLFLTRKNAIFFYLILAISLGIFLYFSFSILDQSIPFLNQWKTYTNPLDQIFLFISGIWMGFLFKEVKIKTIILNIILLTSLLLFIFYPVTGERIYLITGTSRLVLTAASFGVCLAFYKLQFKVPAIVDNGLSKLGHCSYSLYLLHPIIYKVSSKFFNVLDAYGFKVPLPIILTLSGISTLIISYLVYCYYETYFTKKERQLRIYETLEKVSVLNRRTSNLS